LIDKTFATFEANNRIKEAILSGSIISPEEYYSGIQNIQDFLAQTGSRRFIDIPSKYFDDLLNNLTVDITGESRNKAATLQSIDNILAKVAQNPVILQDPNLSKLFNQAVELSGIDFIPSQPQTQSKIQPTSIPTQPAVQKQTEAVLPEAQQ
jgi:hypothetical protein